MRTPGWLSAHVVDVFCGNGDVVFDRLRRDTKEASSAQLIMNIEFVLPAVTKVLLSTARGILIHRQLLKPSLCTTRG